MVYPLDLNTNLTRMIQALAKVKLLSTKVCRISIIFHTFVSRVAGTIKM